MLAECLLLYNQLGSTFSENTEAAIKKRAEIQQLRVRSLSGVM